MYHARRKTAHSTLSTVILLGVLQVMLARQKPQSPQLADLEAPRMDESASVHWCLPIGSVQPDDSSDFPEIIKRRLMLVIDDSQKHGARIR